MQILNASIEYLKNINFDIILDNKALTLVYYLIIINIIGYIITGIDKSRSRNRRFRVREAKFFIISFIGGALGVVMGMTVFRHKTSKRSFYIGIPIIFLFNLITTFFIYRLL
ncbi:DUF1294 domain-containing protein [Alkalithermobacter paradoxus]|uniref:DUF1294 domain-containing protein n=1 Tax=Alkalithermobacter paradoxus TaxID=29349 RepID=A0A1V4IA19_9FIRM|nr:hypothetical protein CLOTH_08800 [[Clostridium] thermoalcaliphilum]